MKQKIKKLLEKHWEIEDKLLGFAEKLKNNLKNCDCKKKDFWVSIILEGKHKIICLNCGGNISIEVFK